MEAETREERQPLARLSRGVLRRWVACWLSPRAENPTKTKEDRVPMTILLSIVGVVLLLSPIFVYLILDTFPGQLDRDDLDDLER